MIERYFNPLKYLEKAQSFFLFGARGTGKTSILNAIFARISKTTGETTTPFLGCEIPLSGNTVEHL